jgi:hypothetical protein
MIQRGKLVSGNLATFSLCLVFNYGSEKLGGGKIFFSLRLR